MSDILLDIVDLTVSFPSHEGMVDAVAGLSLQVRAGEIVGVVGESGSGKSLSALAIMGLLSSPAIIRQGSIMLAGQDVTKMRQKQLRLLRGKEVAMVFQEPLTALNPSLTIGRQLIDTVCAHRPVSKAQARTIAVEALREVGIREAERRLDAYAHEFSGGMRQRVLIAMAIACEPDLLIADEPTTALDVTVQAQIMELFRRLRRERGLSILLISHNLHLVAEMCDRVAVMYAGRIVESGTSEEVFLRPHHPYARLLQECVPTLDNRGQRPTKIPGTAPRPGEIYAGCHFAPRCPQVSEICLRTSPILQGTDGHSSACWLTEKSSERAV